MGDRLVCADCGTEAVHGACPDETCRRAPDQEPLAADIPFDPSTGWNPEAVARAFHETYERLAPEYGYTTRRASAVPWEQVPENNRALMVDVADEVLARLVHAAVMPSDRRRGAPKPHARILRNSPTEVDEVVFHDATVHIEQMDEQCWTVIVDQAGGQWVGNMVCADGRLTFVEQENDGIDWDEDRTHESVLPSGDMAVELPGIEPDKVVDLMEALERSIAEAKAARKRHPQPRRNQ